MTCAATIRSDLCRYQVLNSQRVGLINSGGTSGADDFAEVIRTAVINKRGGGLGLISGRKTFQKPMRDGVALFHANTGRLLMRRAAGVML